LTASIVFHVIHASFWLDFWSIWPDKADLEDAAKRLPAVHRIVRAAAAQIRQIPAGKQAVTMARSS